MSQEEKDAAFQEEAQQTLDILSGAMHDPEAIARAFGHWMKTKMPERVAEAMWMTIEGDRDKGLRIAILERKLPRWPAFKVRLGGLIGAKTVGANIETDVYKTATGITVAVGVGSVSPYSDLKDFRPVASISVRF